MSVGEDKFSELRSRYEAQVLSEIRGVRDQIDKVTHEVGELKLTIAAADLAEMKIRVNRVVEVLQRHDPEKIAEALREAKKDYDDRLDKVEKFQTRALAILGFLNVLLGLFAIFRDYILPRKTAAPPAAQTGMMIWHLAHSIVMYLS